MTSSTGIGTYNFFTENHGKKQGLYKGRTKRVKGYSSYRSFYWSESHCQVKVVSTKSHCLLSYIILQIVVVAKKKGSSQYTEEQYWPSVQKSDRKFCGSGSGQICIILPDPNPDRDRLSGHADPGPANPDCVSSKLIKILICCLKY
jgi:hypothetical protein